MTKKNYSKYEAKEELVTLSFNHVLLHKKDTKIYQVIFLSLLSRRKLHPTTSLAPFFGARDFCFKIIKKAKNKSKSIEISYT